MGLKDIALAFRNAVYHEYDRRIRAASNVRDYTIGGHDHHDTPVPEEQPGEADAGFGTSTRDPAMDAHPTVSMTH